MAESNLYERILDAASGAVPDKKAATPRHSAAVILWRRDPDLEVFWVRRSAQLRFMGGWYAFPGGALAPSDKNVELHGTAAGLDVEYNPTDVPGGDPALGPLAPTGVVCCALRELFEETGVLAHSSDSDPSAESLSAARDKLLEDAANFPAALKELGVTPDASGLVWAGRWVTPRFSPVRFDARFFLLEWPATRAHQPIVIPGELDVGEWISPAEGVRRWAHSEALIAQPILHALRVLSQDGPDGVNRLRPGPDGPAPFRIEFRRGINSIPLRTRTLPPASTTNAIVMGGRDMVLIDPGSDGEEQIAILNRAARSAAQAAGGIIKAIWLTHHHQDHTAGVEQMRKTLGVPVCAHPLTAQRLAEQGIEVDQLLQDGQIVTLAGDPPMRIRVLHTPGHARGHLCFYDEGSKTLIAGDIMSAQSTIVIDPPEGNMTDYLDSIDKLIAVGPDVALPSHGTLISKAVEKLKALKAHRLRREERILKAWQDGVKEPADIVPAVYTDIGEMERPLAERQVIAHLERLEGLRQL